MFSQAISYWIAHYGYAGLFTLLLLGIVGLPVPDETLLVYAGYLIGKGELAAVPAGLL
jgi:membrane protein DedA with SNARE-associated domain